MVWYLNGKFVNSTGANIPVTDLGLCRGWALFEYLRTYGQKPFMIEQHFDRFYSSAQELYLVPPLNRKSLEKLIYKLLEQKKFSTEMGVKILLTAGESADGLNPSRKPTFAVMVFPVSQFPQSFYRRGIKLYKTFLKRFFPQVKTVNYLSAMVALKEAKNLGFDDALFCSDGGEVLEATRSNFFYFHSNVLHTTAKGVLPGITRGLVIGLASKSFTVKEGPVNGADLRRADEAFITSSDKEIMPVVQVGDLKIGNGRVGAKTKFLMGEFKNFVSSYYGKY